MLNSTADTGLLLSDLHQPVFDAQALRAKRQAIETGEQQRQLNQQNLQQGQLDLEQKRRDAMQDAEDQKILKQAYRNSGGKIEKMQEIALQGGASPKAITALQKYASDFVKQKSEQNKLDLDNEAATAEAIGRGAQGLIDMEDEASRAIHWRGVRGIMVQQGHVDPAEIPEEYPGLDYLIDHRNGAVMLKDGLEFANRARLAKIQEGEAKLRADKDAREAPGQIADAAQKERTNDAAALAAAARQSPEAFAAALGELPHKRAIAFAGAKNPEEILQRGMTPTEQTSATNRANEVAKLNTPAELAAIAADTTQPPERRANANAALNRLNEFQKAGRPVTFNTADLSPEAKQMYADMLKSGLPLPSFGRNDGKTKGEISNLAASSGGVDLASARSDYKANSASLVKLQQNRDQVAAFEGTALKNLDQFLTTAKGVYDYGGPFVNGPMRKMMAKAGSPEVTAFNAARQVALVEIAKVLSNPGLGGQLSDSSRHEVQELIGPDATFKQIYRAAQLLKTDMKNRADSLDSKLSEIRARIGKQADPAGTATPAATHRYNPATGKIEAVK